MITITKGQALEALTEAVKEKGAGYVYVSPRGHDGAFSGCLYTDSNSRPSCIVGNALTRLGVPIEVLHAIDWGGAVYLDDYDEDEDKYLDTPVERTLPAGSGLGETSIDDDSVMYWLKRNDVIIDDGALFLFGKAQAYQDDLQPWGEAVSKALGETGSVVK